MPTVELSTTSQHHRLAAGVWLADPNAMLQLSRSSGAEVHDLGVEALWRFLPGSFSLCNRFNMTYVKAC